MAGGNTIVPIKKYTSADENDVSEHILILPARSWYGGDEWVGTADELIAAGLVARDQLPGEPGNNKVSATYYNGRLVRKSSHNPHDEHYLSVTRYGRQKFIVRKGVSEEEKQRRETKEILLKKSPDVDFISIPPPLFYIGEKVVVHRACVEVVDIRYDKGDQYNSKGYAYKVNPNLDERYNWFAEELLYKYTAKPASIIPLLCAATEPVQQPRRRGRLPKNIASVWVARYKRRCQDEELSKLREVLRDLNISIEIDRKIIGEQRAKLIEVKGKIQELLR